MMKTFLALNTSNSKTGRYIANLVEVMMQAFIGTYPAEIQEILYATAWSNAGIGSIWLPPVSKAQTELFYGL
jgi:alpha-amylase